MVHRGLRSGVVAVVVVALGCGEAERRSPTRRRPLGPIAPDGSTSTPLGPVPGQIAPLARATAIAGAAVQAQILLITSDGTSAAVEAMRQTLQYTGTPFEVLNAASAPPLTTQELVDGARGRYQGIILDRGNLSTGSVGAFSDAEWAVLARYEAERAVRRVALYTYPEAAYGLSGGGGIDTSAEPLSLRCTARGAVVFSSINCQGEVPVRNAWAYPATVLDPGTTTPLLVDGAGRVFAAVHRYADGREVLVFTFDQGPSLVHSLALLHDALAWVARDVYLGERHTYVGAQIDDLFLATALYRGLPDGGADDDPDGPTYRITDADLQALFDWQQELRRDPLMANLRLDWAANGVGAASGDPLTEKARAIGPGFKWISHTWDHPVLDGMSYAEAYDEVHRNDEAMRRLGLLPYSVRSLVTPHVSGLDDATVMAAVFDAGVRYVVTDTSVPGYDNPAPNLGMPNRHRPGILMVPRRPTNLFYDTSTPSEWAAEYNDLYRSFWGRDLAYDEIADFESELLLRYMLRGENDPWMFHQANARDFGRGLSLLRDLLGRAFDKYRDICRLPVVSPPFEELAPRVAARMRTAESGASAVIADGRIVVRVERAATVPVTGVCTPGAESYGGRTISHLQLAAGEQIDLALSGCNEPASPERPDAGSDARDAGTTPLDAGSDARDAGTTPLDAGSDARDASADGRDASDGREAGQPPAGAGPGEPVIAPGDGPAGASGTGGAGEGCQCTASGAGTQDGRGVLVAALAAFALAVRRRRGRA